MRNFGRTLLLLAMASLAACDGAEDGNNQAAANLATGGNAVMGADAPTSTIAQTITGSNDHNMLERAVKSAGLEATMAGAQPYTVFAPTDAAFAKLPAGTVDELMTEGAKGQLTALLTYHVVPGVITSRDLAAAIAKGDGTTTLATVGGGTLTATSENGGITITDAKGGKARVSGADMLQTNGVVHVVDGVLMPS